MKKIYVFLLAFIMSVAWGQDGALDTSFANGNSLLGSWAIAREPATGNILVGGINSTSPSVIRLSPTGTPLSFPLPGVFTDPLGFSADFNIRAICVQSDNKILIGGFFLYTVGGVQYQNVIRVTSTGAIDPTFVCNIPQGLHVETIKIQPVTGKILVGGTNWGTSSVKPFYRLHSSTSTGTPGNIDTSFLSAINYFTGVAVHSISTYEDTGNIIIGGAFTNYSNIARRNIAKLDVNGNLITGFNVTGIDFSDYSDINILSTAIDSNQNILIGGNFTHTTTGFKHLIRVTPSGTVDTSFITDILPATEYGVHVHSIIVQCDKKIVIGGSFSIGTGINMRKGLARLNESGSNDSTFNTGGTGITEQPTHIYGIAQTIQAPDMRLFICGEFSAYNGTARNSVAKVKINYTLDAVNDTPNSITTAGGTLLVNNPIDNSLVIANVLANDTAYGNAADNTNVNLTQQSITPSPSSGGISLNTSTGAITVNAGTPAGTYTLTYKICPKTAPTCTTCDTATVTIIVTSLVLDAVDDILYTNGIAGCNGTTLMSVLTNDKINGFGLFPSNVPKIILTYSSPYPGITMTTTSATPSLIGKINVAPGVPAGVYVITYRITDANFPGNYDEATVTINLLGTVNAVDDTVTVNSGTAYTNILNVISNDTYDCHAAAATPGVNISLISAPISGITLNTSTGMVSVNSTVAPGIYTLTYQICDKVFTPAYSCDTATVTITVMTPASQLGGYRANNAVYQIETQSNNKIIIRGTFTNYEQQQLPVVVNRIARLKSDLTFDNTFNSSGAFENSTPVMLSAIAIYTDGIYKDYIIAAGRFNSISGGTANDIVRLTPDGNIDPTFSSGTGISTTTNPGSEMISAVAIHDGKIIISGNFDKYNGNTRMGIARLKYDGTLDDDFDPEGGFFLGNGPTSIAVDSNGRIVIAGSFTAYRGQTMNKIGRLIGDDPDPLFTATNSLTGGTDEYRVKLQSDNNIIFYGKFTNYNSTGKNNIVRLKAADGTVDPFFTGTGTSTGGKIEAVEIDPLTGYIYIGGGIYAMNGTSSTYYLGRFTNTGGVDNSFIGGYGPSLNVYSLKRQVDGKMLIGGFFNHYNDVSFAPANYGNITRINPSIVGSQQRTINNDIEIEKTISSITIYPNPSEGVFNIDFKGYDEQKFDITVHNTLGQLIYQGVVTPENTNQIDLTRFESGSYFISLVNNKETINKVVIKK